MEELLLETAEEPLRGRVVRRTAFRAHRTRQTMLLADADPLGPPVVAATVGMDDWFLPVPERGARVGEHAVGQRRVRVRADRPRDGKPVVAVDDGRQIGLACGNRELGQVRDPQHVRTLGVEVAVHQVLRRLGQLACFVSIFLKQFLHCFSAARGGDVFLDFPTGRRTPLWQGTAGSSATGPWTCTSNTSAAPPT